MREAYKEAIGAIRTPERDQISQRDFIQLVTLFNRLMECGLFVDHPAVIASYVNSVFGDETIARDVQIIYETLEILHKGGTPGVDTVLQKILPYN